MLTEPLRSAAVVDTTGSNVGVLPEPHKLVEEKLRGHQ